MKEKLKQLFVYFFGKKPEDKPAETVKAEEKPAPESVLTAPPIAITLPPPSVVEESKSEWKEWKKTPEPSAPVAEAKHKVKKSVNKPVGKKPAAMSSKKTTKKKGS